MLHYKKKNESLAFDTIKNDNIIIEETSREEDDKETPTIIEDSSSQPFENHGDPLIEEKNDLVNFLA